MSTPPESSFDDVPALPGDEQALIDFAAADDASIASGDEVAISPDEEATEGAEHRRFTVSRDSDHRLDKYLFNHIRNASRNQIQKLIAAGGITVNQTTPKNSTKLRKGDVIDVMLPPPPVKYLLPEQIPLHVLYEDTHFIVLNKQANLIVHPARSHLSGTLINGLAYHFLKAAGHDPDSPDFQAKRLNMGAYGLSDVGLEDCRPGIIHRLDKNTTGVIVVGKTDEAHWRIARQFEQRTTLKAYLALVHGSLPGVGGVIDEPLGKHPTMREAYAVRRDSQGKASVTLYRVRERYRGYTLVELELKTGRTHQIRVHLSYLGLPIVGDIIYGGEPVGQHELDHPPIAAGSRPFLTFARDKEQGEQVEQQARARTDLILAHPALHAALLEFTHPISKERVRFTAPLHEPMRSLVHELRQRPAEGPIADQGTWIDLAQACP